MENPDEPEFPRPIASVDLVIFAQSDRRLDVLLARRANPPFVGDWALPGGFVHADVDADLEAAARRVLSDKTGVETPYLEQLASFGGATRDPRGWSLSVVYMALILADRVTLRSGAGTTEAQWFQADTKVSLAFDHRDILGAALDRLRSKVGYSTLPAHLLPEAFTLGELQAVYEGILGRALEKSAFRKRIAEADFVEPITGEMRRASNRPAQLYRLKRARHTTLFDRAL
ncbi:MAG TPA: NUDIX domain-containing protein [Devosia sp.]|jgi:ADP-ribose pyrophosphatase YjhB (NUDIX family)|uniref:NUDIX hydrolase n=1 Tax=Devosia sp. TaxID=1871048 RepID=UPI002DDD2994|nr:NUDIX domain-containing protein [Devosia sp.]HEV2518543.1 NUDIX domain-containing protein [Devosia sp.]